MKKTFRSWQMKSLDEVCKIVNGGTPKTKIEKYWGGAHCWITPAEMNKTDNPYISKTNRTLSDEGLQKCSAKLVPPFSVILSTRAPIGHLIINKEQMATNQGCRSLVPCNSLHYKYLYFFLWHSVDFLNSLGTGATFKELSAGKLRKVKIPFPPLPEQQRIVSILDEVFEGIGKAVANVERNLENSRELFESVLNNVFTQKGEGWETKRLEKLCAFSSGGTPSKKKSDYWDGNIPWVSGKEMKRDFIDDTLLHISDKAVADNASRIVPKGTLLILVRGMGLANGVPIAELKQPCAFNQDIKAIHPHDHIDSRFLLFALKNEAKKTEVLLNRAAHGTLKINMEDLKAVKISYPSLQTQCIVVSKIEKLIESVYQLQSIYQQKLSSLQELKQSILQKAFTGELTAKTVDKIMESV